MLIIGVDPGATGAIAALVDGNLAEVVDTPTLTLTVGGRPRKRVDPQGVAMVWERMLRDHGGLLGEVLVVLEEVGPMPKDGAVQSFTFGASYGFLVGVAVGMRLPMREVRPPVWKKALKLKRDKDASRQRAMQLWPGFREQFARASDDGRAEAALIGHWAHAQLTQKGFV